MRKFIGIAALTIASVCRAQALWQGTAYGNTIEEVQAKIPALGAPQRSDELSQQGILALMIAPVKLVEKPFDAYFYFSEVGLNKVIFIMKDLLSKREADAVHNMLIQALHQKYGRAAKVENPARAVIEDKPLWFKYTSGDTDILLVPQHHSQKLMIGYTLSEREKERADAEATKKYIKKVNPKLESERL